MDLVRELRRTKVSLAIDTAALLLVLSLLALTTCTELQNASLADQCRDQGGVPVRAQGSSGPIACLRADAVMTIENQ